MIAAYFDDSGTDPRYPALVVGGVIATVDNWAAFQREWRSILEEYDLEYFHMTDFDNYQGLFARDKFNENDRIPLQSKLIHILKKRIQAIVVAATNKKDYSAVQDVYGCPTYAYTVYQCLGGVAQWADDAGYDGPIVYVFDKGGGSKALGTKGSLDELKRNITERKDLVKQFRMTKLEAWNYGFMKELNPLQGADMIAYEAWKDLQNDYFSDKPAHWRKSVEKLITMERLYHGYFDKEVFAANPSMWAFLMRRIGR